MGGTQDSQTTAAKRGRQVSVRSETLGEVIEWLGDADDSQTCNLPPCYGGHRLQTDMTAYDLLLELGVIDDPYARNKERD